MNSLEQLSIFIEEHCSAYRFKKEPANLYDPLRYFMTLGGKRMRPILTIMGANLFGVEKEESIHAALAIEFFHNFSLIHDDIMDVAPLRRGKDTVHEKWNTNIAILSGDALFVEAYQNLAKYTDDRLPILLKRFNETALEVCEGQQMDMDFETRETVSEQEYLEMIRLKTSVLLGCAFEFGAILGKQDEKIRRRLYNFGVSLGLAFQIQDDILDLYADPEKFGKQVGGDVLSNKKTLLLINALETQDERVIELLAMEPNEFKIDVAKSLFTELGCLEKVIRVKEYYHSEALKELDALSQMQFNVKPLQDLSEFLLVREH